MKNISTILFSISLLLLFSCEGKTEGDAEGISYSRNLHINAASLSPNALSNIQVYAFNGSGASQFSHRVYTMTQTGNILSMVVPSDTWNFVLLSAESGSLGQASVPVVGSQRAVSKMWTCPNNGTSLLSAPEIITARTGSILINPGVSVQTDASLARNVAMITVKINDVAGVKASGSHTISLLDVPESLTWNGGLYPDKTNPDVSSLPMSAAATLHDNTVQNTQYSDEVTFLVPAHQGVDFLSEEVGFPKDTSTHLLRIAVDLELTGGGRLQREATLPLAPKANRRMEVGLRVGSNLNVTATIHDWVEHNVDADLAHTTLMVSKTNVGLSSRDTVYVQTNATSGFALSSGAPSWLTVTNLDGNRVVVSANTDSYIDGEPRTSYFTVTANNVTKRINVTQRPDVGTITVSPSPFWVSPTSGNASRAVAVTSTGDWEFIAPSPATVTPSVNGGSPGTTSVTFSRKSHTGEITDYENYYGTSVFKVKNKTSLEIITFTADNLYLESPEQINVNGSGGTSYNDDIISMGLSGEYVITGVTYNATGTGWLDVSIEDGRFKTTADREPDENTRWCTVTIAHKDDLNYTIPIRVEQNPYYDIIDPFTFLTGKFDWDAYTIDMDIAVLIYDDHGKSILPAGRWMGYGGNHPGNNKDILYKGHAIARYGGDPTSNALAGHNGEAFVIYMNAFDNLEDFPLNQLDRYINVYMYAWWWTSPGTNDKAYLSLQYWLEGEIVPNEVMKSTGGSGAYVYTNPTGTNINPDPEPKKLINPTKTRSGSPTIDLILNTSNSTTGMTKIARVRYDRLTHKATPVWYTSEDNANWPTTNVALPAAAPLMMEPMNFVPKE